MGGVSSCLLVAGAVGGNLNGSAGTSTAWTMWPSPP